MTPEVCVEFHLMALFSSNQLGLPASFILMSPPEEYSGCKGAGEVFQTGARCFPPNFSVKY